MEACRAALTVDAHEVLQDPTLVMEAQGKILGFYQLRLQGTGDDIRMVFVAPEALCSGRISSGRRGRSA